MNKDYRDEENPASVSRERKGKKTQMKTQQEKRSKPTCNEEVDFYAQRRILALVMWYLPVVDHLRCLFANPEDAELMSWHASDERKDDESYDIRPMQSNGKISIRNIQTLPRKNGM